MIFENEEWVKQYFIDAYPNEACGLIYDNYFHACDNKSATPTECFKIDKHDYMKALKSKTGLQAVIHSHPILPTTDRDVHICTPSASDMNGQADTNVPWTIYATDGINISAPLTFPQLQDTPLIGREFIHGVHDCYSIVRDYYFQKFGMKLINWARDYEWWEQDGISMYVHHLPEMGFRQIQEHELKKGDIVLMNILGKAPNHAAVYDGGDVIIHHLAGRLSTEDSLYKWRRQITHYWRHPVND